MHGNIPAEAQRSIFPAAELRSESLPEKSSAEVRSDSCGWFADLAQKLWPAKTAATLQFLTGRKERQCYAMASGASEPFGSVIVALLRSDEGERVLDRVMLGCKSAWNKRRIDDRRDANILRAAIAEHAKQFELQLD